MISSHDEFDYEYRSPSIDEPGIYLLVRKSHLLNGESTALTTFNVKVGMAYTKACRRAKNQRSWCIDSRLFTDKGEKIGFLDSHVIVRDIRYTAAPTQLIEAVEGMYHAAMRDRWELTPGWGYEWFQVDEDFYNKVLQQGFEAFDNIVPSIANLIMQVSY